MALAFLTMTTGRLHTLSQYWACTGRDGVVQIQIGQCSSGVSPGMVDWAYKVDVRSGSAHTTGGRGKARERKRRERHSHEKIQNLGADERERKKKGKKRERRRRRRKDGRRTSESVKESAEALGGAATGGASAVAALPRWSVRAA
eukprot:1628478-Rhodomonas_salina.5